MKKDMKSIKESLEILQRLDELKDNMMKLEDDFKKDKKILTDEVDILMPRMEKIMGITDKAKDMINDVDVNSLSDLLMDILGHSAPRKKTESIIIDGRISNIIMKKFKTCQGEVIEMGVNISKLKTEKDVLQAVEDMAYLTVRDGLLEKDSKEYIACKEDSLVKLMKERKEYMDEHDAE